MKKIIVLCNVIALMAVLAACGGGSSKSPATPQTTAVESKETSEKKETEEIQTKAEEKVDFEEITVVDNEQCMIKITGIEPDDTWGYALKAYFENKTEDKTLMFSVRTASVNCVEADPFFAADVAAGKKSNESISFDRDKLAANGIKEFTDIQIEFWVYNVDDYEDDVCDEIIHIYPLGEDKAEKFVRERQPGDQVIVENDDVTVICIGFTEDEFWGYTANLYIENKTDKSLGYSADQVSVNGYMIEPYWATTVGAGHVAFSDISWDNAELEANGIETVENIEMELRVYNEEDWTADYLLDEMVTLTP